mmetsp:Transcript_25649/g.56761  ORF Transcript_25649/g.56761 Transcript_25649/m.56761 type:complete len:286 (+) Transcript_25649:1038-1895(+)
MRLADVADLGEHSLDLVAAPPAQRGLVVRGVHLLRVHLHVLVLLEHSLEVDHQRHQSQRQQGQGDDELQCASGVELIRGRAVLCRCIPICHICVGACLRGKQGVGLGPTYNLRGVDGDRVGGAGDGRVDVDHLRVVAHVSGGQVGRVHGACAVLRDVCDKQVPHCFSVALGGQRAAGVVGVVHGDADGLRGGAGAGERVRVSVAHACVGELHVVEVTAEGAAHHEQRQGGEGGCGEVEHGAHLDAPVALLVGGVAGHRGDPEIGSSRAVQHGLGGVDQGGLQQRA